MIQYIHESCGLPPISNNVIILYEDNVVCIIQLGEGILKEIGPNIFLQSSFTYMSSKTKVRLIYNKLDLVVILSIYVVRHYMLQH